MSEYKEQFLQMLNAAKDPEAMNFFIELAMPILGKVDLKFFIADAIFDDLKAFIFEHCKGTQYELNEIKSALEDMRYDFYTMLGWADSASARRITRKQLDIALNTNTLPQKYILAAKLIQNTLQGKGLQERIKVLGGSQDATNKSASFFILNEQYSLHCNLMRYFATYENQLN